jgi:hypothetical protein
MRDYSARSIAMHYAFSAVWQAATTAAITGTVWHLWENPKGLRTRIFAGTDPEGRDRYAMSPIGYFAKDLENASWAVWGLAKGNLEPAQQFARSKMAVAPKLIAEGALGFRDPFERREARLGGQSFVQGLEAGMEKAADAAVPYRTVKRDPVGGLMAELGAPFRRAQTSQQVASRLRGEQREFTGAIRGAYRKGDPRHGAELQLQWQRRQQELLEELQDVQRYESRKQVGAGR